ncbi:MAG: hypothetical protein J6X79_05355 [Bacteroidales bacterium]|nr:hypothetical protein [Bacteroidales bacterium]
MSLYRAPKPKVDGKQPFIKQVLMIILSTTISLILTLTAISLVEQHHRKKDRRMSAMMVMSNIESFARTLENRSNALARADSVGTWLLAQPLGRFDTMPEEVLNEMIEESLKLQFVSHDHTAENIFSNNIETWKNMGNFEFIDKVGQCFSSINTVEEYWNGWVNDVESVKKEITSHPSDYVGAHKGSKFMHNDELRNRIGRVHNWRGWMKYVAATLRYHNRENLRAIGITEEALMDFTDERTREVKNPEPVPDANDYYMPQLSLDSLVTLPPSLK